MLELVPISDMEAGRVKERNHVVMSEQYTIERLGGGILLLDVLGENDLLDEGIDAGIGNAGKIT